MNTKHQVAWGTSTILLAGVMAAAAVNAETVVGEPDAYLDYIEANGSQYIDTGVNAETGLKARMDMQIPSSGNNDTCVLGARHSDIRFLMIHSVEATSKPFVGYGNGSNRSWRPSSTFPTDSFEYISDFSDGTAVQVYVNEYADRTGMISSSSQAALAGSTPRGDGEITTNDMNNITLYLFAANYDGTASWQSSARLYRLKIMKKNAETGRLDLIRNYIPCLKDTRAALYDTVEGKIYFSNTGTDFAGGEVVMPVPCEYVAWIESRTDSGDNYIDTGIRGRSGVKSEVACSVRSNFASDQAILACRSSSGTATRFFMAYFYGGYFGYGYKNGYWGSNGGANQVAVANNADARYLIKSELSAGLQSVTVNGTELHKGDSYVEDDLDSGTTLTLFGLHTASDNSVACRSNIRLYSAKIWDGDELMRDFVPCVDSSGQAGLWDRVTCRMFKSSDAYDFETQVGAVTNGPAIPAGTLPDSKIGYIESDGVYDYFDLEVTAKDGVEMEAVMEWVEVPSDNIFAGALDGSGLRFYLMGYSSSSKFYFGYLGNIGKSGSYGAEAAQTGVKYYVTTRLDGDGSQFLSIRHRDGGSWVWDGASGGMNFAYPGPFVSERSIYLFANNNQGTPDLFTRARVYSLKIREKQQDGSYALVRDLVPCKYDGKPMLYDKVCERFFQKKGNGRYYAAGGGAERPWQVGCAVIIR